MGDLFYRAVRLLGGHVFWVSSRPTVLHAERAPVHGPCIVVANHHSPFDVPVLIHHTPALLDFVSITELFRKPLVGRFYGAMNAFPLERSRPDPATVRKIVDRLERGRVVALFPEGRLRDPSESVTNGGAMRKGAGRLAVLTGAPVLPCVMLGTGAYRRPAAWLPLRRVRYGLIFGEPILASRNLPQDAAAADVERQVVESLLELTGELRQAWTPTDRSGVTTP